MLQPGSLHYETVYTVSSVVLLGHINLSYLSNFNDIKKEADWLPLMLKVYRHRDKSSVIRRSPCIGRKMGLSFIFLVLMVSYIFSLKQ